MGPGVSLLQVPQDDGNVLGRLARHELPDGRGGERIAVLPAQGHGADVTVARGGQADHLAVVLQVPQHRPVADGQQHPLAVPGQAEVALVGLAARHADELNVDGLDPSELAAALPVIRSRCEEIGRDPATLPVSVHIWTRDVAAAGQRRVDQLGAYRELGVSRVMALLQPSATDDEALPRFVEDARAAGVTFAA